MSTLEAYAVAFEVFVSHSMEDKKKMNFKLNGLPYIELIPIPGPNNSFSFSISDLHIDDFFNDAWGNAFDTFYSLEKERIMDAVNLELQELALQEVMLMADRERKEKIKISKKEVQLQAIEELVDALLDQDTRILTSEEPDNRLTKMDFFFRMPYKIDPRVVRINSVKVIKKGDLEYFLAYPTGSDEKTGGVFLNPSHTLKSIIEKLMPFYPIELITDVNHQGKRSAVSLRISNLIEPNEYDRVYIDQLSNILKSLKHSLINDETLK
ncbi:hypothetical protein RAC89_25285 [Paenibacillus sp. GD4]|uniref:hypothetical protein n=1 Tax=Paenibacillus sp. GD4 TaxID=3068890 RepID=UPI002796CDC1|nr:hypothetical protein [Paenibacillus sp. GD4]MDQ1913719.1 hypothetical protein [Paenibacillus sp. GD4]